ncbi:hypothetical protein HYW84_03810, partial [Candidatus Peregrinibacteria bacterium]|nr:hypothetical protein [Candidatus Peregrinibacteria bacterium]
MATELYYPYEGGEAFLSCPVSPDFPLEKLGELQGEVRRILGKLPVFSSEQEEKNFYQAWDTQMRVHHMDDDE